MSLRKGIRRPKLGPKATKALKLIRDRFAAGEPLTVKMVVQAHDEAYGLKGNKKRLTQYYTSNLKRPLFASALMDARFAARVLKLGAPSRYTAVASLLPDSVYPGDI